MKRSKQILGFLILLPFLVSIFGILVFQSHCSCSGKDNVSFFVSHKTCGHSESRTHKVIIPEEKNCCREISHYCQSTEKNCNCSKPKVFLVKLKSPFAQEDSAFSFQKKLNFTKLFLPEEIFSFGFQPKKLLNEERINPPPLLFSSAEFLTIICQRKIPGMV